MAGQKMNPRLQAALAGGLLRARRTAHFTRMRIADRRRLARARREHGGKYRGGDPLVSIFIVTYNRADVLVERTIPSILAQSYERLELVIVGDACDDDTVERVKGLNDPRVRVCNLPERPTYPSDPHKRWMVAGSHAVNEALKMVRGEWIGYSNDCDLFTRDHNEKLLRHAQAKDLEFVHGRYEYEVEPGRWQVGGRAGFPTGKHPFQKGGVPQMSALYRRYLRFARANPDAWKYQMAGDNYRWHRLGGAGVRSGFLEEVVARAPLRPRSVMRTADHVRTGS